MQKDREKGMIKMTVKSYFLSFYLLNYFRNICYSEIANKDPMEKQKGRRTRAASDFNTYDSYSYISSGNYCRRQEKFDYVLKNSRLLADDFEKDTCLTSCSSGSGSL